MQKHFIYSKFVLKVSKQFHNVCLLSALSLWTRVICYLSMFFWLTSAIFGRYCWYLMNNYIYEHGYQFWQSLIFEWIYFRVFLPLNKYEFFKAWLSEIKEYAPHDAVVLLLGNKVWPRYFFVCFLCVRKVLQPSTFVKVKVTFRH